MKILKIEQSSFGDENSIIVTIDKYPHAQPVFPADTKAEDLKGLLEAWKINQDEVDDANATESLMIKEEVKVNQEILDLVNTNILTAEESEDLKTLNE